MIKKFFLIIIIILLFSLFACQFNGNLWDNANDSDAFFCDKGSGTNSVEISGTNPENGDNIVPENHIIVTFDTPIKPETITKSSIQVLCNATEPENNGAAKEIIANERDKQVKGSLEINNDVESSVVTFIPETNFLPGDYILNIFDSIQDKKCNTLKSNREIRFSVRRETVLLGVKKTYPEMSQERMIYIKKNTKVSILFNKLMKKANDYSRRQGTVIAKLDGRNITVSQEWIGGDDFSTLFRFQLKGDVSSIQKSIQIVITLEDFKSAHSEELDIEPFILFLE